LEKTRTEPVRMRPLVIVIGALVVGALSACAARQELKETPLTPVTKADREELVPAQPTNDFFDAKALAAKAVSAAECAKHAKWVKERNPKDGWALLNACVEKGDFQRGAFTDVKLVLDPIWDEDFATQPNAGKLVARLIALRGGDIDGDLPRFQKTRLPVFPLSAAMRQPDVYKGRLVLVRATYEDVKTAGNATSAKLSETALATAKTETEREGHKHGSTRSSSGNLSASYNTTNYGSGSGSVGYSSQSSYKTTNTMMKYENVAKPTGLSAIAKLPQADPFLQPGKDYLFLVRFDGARTVPTESEDKPEQLGVVTVLTYHTVAPLLVD